MRYLYNFNKSIYINLTQFNEQKYKVGLKGFTTGCLGLKNGEIKLRYEEEASTSKLFEQFTLEKDFREY